MANEESAIGKMIIDCVESIDHVVHVGHGRERLSYFEEGGILYHNQRWIATRSGSQNLLAVFSKTSSFGESLHYRFFGVQEASIDLKDWLADCVVFLVDDGDVLGEGRDGDGGVGKRGELWGDGEHGLNRTDRPGFELVPEEIE
jgi:hypothetical protein